MPSLQGTPISLFIFQQREVPGHALHAIPHKLGLWSYVDFTPIQNRYKKAEEVPAKTELSEKISKDLKKQGMNFVGPTIIYALMQAVGMVNDHELSCFRYSECMELAHNFNGKEI